MLVSFAAELDGWGLRPLKFGGSKAEVQKPRNEPVIRYIQGRGHLRPRCKVYRHDMISGSRYCFSFEVFSLVG